MMRPRLPRKKVSSPRHVRMWSLWFRRVQSNGQMTLYGVSVLLAPDHGLVGLTIIATGALKSACVEVAGTNAKLCVLDPILRAVPSSNAIWAFKKGELVCQKCRRSKIYTNLQQRAQPLVLTRQKSRNALRKRCGGSRSIQHCLHCPHISLR